MRNLPQRPLLLLALAFGIGIASPSAVPPGLASAFLPLAAALAALRGGLLPLALLCASFLWAGLLLRPAPIAPWTGPEVGPCARILESAGLSPPGLERSRVEVEGQIRGSPAIGGEGNRALLLVERARETKAFLERGPWRAPAGLLLELRLPREHLPLPGDRLRATLQVDDPPPASPLARRAFEQRRRQGIACVARVEGGQIAVSREAKGLLPGIESSRRRLATEARSRLASPEASALVPALMVGERSGIDPELRAAFTDSGLAHVLSVSGLHLSLCVLGAYRILRAILQRILGHLVDVHRGAALLALPLAPLYAAYTGGQPPVLRAAIGAGLFLLAQVLARRSDAWISLGVAFLGVLAHDPPTLFSPSFQLSFAACAGLLGLSPSLRRIFRRAKRPGIWGRALNLLSASLIATSASTLATLPLIALYFQRVSLSSLLANLVSVPVAMLATALCASAGVAGLLLRPAFEPLLGLAGWLCELLAHLARFFASLPGSRIFLPLPSLAELLAFSGLLAGIALLHRSRRAGLALGAASLLALGALHLLPSPSPGLSVEFLPVGQGDATLLRLPSGEAVLVDTGGELRGESDRAEFDLLPLLAERGIRRLRALVLSHLHPDHVGSAPTLLSSLRVDEVWFSGRALEGRLGAPIAEMMRAREIPLRKFAAGSPPYDVGGVRFEFLGPPDPEGIQDEPFFGDNDASLVLRVVHGEVAILLPGDVEAEGERALLESGAELRADLLKAPHHGSRTSSNPALLDRIRPSHAVFCIGWRNHFGFPHAEVLRRYRERGISTYQTDTGPVLFHSDGKTIQYRRPAGIFETISVTEGGIRRSGSAPGGLPRGGDDSSRAR